MDVTSNHLDVVARGGFGWREEVDDGEEIARRSETFGHPVGKSASVFGSLPLLQLFKIMNDTRTRTRTP